MRMSLLLAAALLLASLVPARAQILPPRPDDEVTLTLHAESFVETGTARVTVAFETALDGAGAGEMRGRLKAVLSGLADQGDWRFTRFDRVVDPAGLERWRVEAEARLPEALLGGLADKAKAASKPGIQARIAGIDFTPTLAEREAGYAKLRADLYAQAEAELARLKSAISDRPYRIKRVNFQAEGEPPRPIPLPGTMRAQQAPQLAQAAPQAFAAEPSVARHIGLTALVTLATTAPQP